MGRSYDKKNAKKGLKPTERQKKTLENKENKSAFHDGAGNTEFKLQEDYLKFGRQLEKELGAKRCKEILELGIAGRDGVEDDEFLALNTLRIWRDEQKGIIRNERDDPKFKFNLQKRIESSRNAEIEFGTAYDAKGRFWGNFIGNKNHVTAILPPSTLIGGTFLHNHPSGSVFSAKDHESFQWWGVKNAIVTSHKGVYSIEYHGTPKYNKVDVAKYQEEYFKRFAQVREASALRPDVPQRTWDNIKWAEGNDLMKRFARQFGLTYKFKPTKEYEDFPKMTQEKD